MRELTSPSRVIKTHWFNRAMFYWIPTIFVVGGLSDLMGVGLHVVGTRDALTAIAIGIVMALVCECLFFGFRVSIYDDRLVYRFRGFPLHAEKTIERAAIVRAKYEAAIRADYKPWRFVEVFSRANGAPKATRINLASFSGPDIDFLLRLLPNLER